MKNYKKLLFAAILVAGSSMFSLSTNAAEQTEARLMRFPDIKGDMIVFSYAGDLYLTSDKGGVSMRLTSSVGYEMFPKFS